MEKINVKKLKGVKPEPSLLDEFEGKYAKIGVIEDELLVMETQYGTKYALKIVTEPVTTITNKDGQEIVIRASELFNLKQLETGEFEYSKHPDSKLQKFLNKQGVNKPENLIGTSVKLRIRSKDGKNYLGYETK